MINKGNETIEEISNMLDKLPSVSLRDFQAKNTTLVIVDMINGFVREGALHSSRVEAIIPEIVKLSRACDESHIEKIVFSDCHTEDSTEFGAYPVHCLEGTRESEIVDEIKEIGGYKLITKNSTNGFLEEKFQKWLGENRDKNTFIITGDCTDICIQQFGLTLKTWFNMKNKKSRIIVPINAVETYDAEMHNGDLMNAMALYNMIINGIEVVKNINS
ncbi:cysteine hydrolase family protein [Clostridium akagii]|uniref:cysteine hydrolase family protein n=1 Tax=Clostridium akagii TaxID=91623 RepID=UPI00047C0931|nr:isochorismatase family cysteine hydrolase [Clostridium akagii]